MTPGAEDLVEETVTLRPGEEPLHVLRPRDAEALLDEAAFEHEERLPYWAELWPSGVALARRVAARPPRRGARVLELGCGLGLPSLAAARAGARVLATDWAPDALARLERNAARNRIALEAAAGRWDAPEALAARGPFDLVLAADVLYERRNGPLLLGLLDHLRAPEVWLADPQRPPAPDFLARAAARGWSVASAADARHPAVVHHTLQPLPFESAG